MNGAAFKLRLPSDAEARVAFDAVETLLCSAEYDQDRAVADFIEHWKTLHEGQRLAALGMLTRHVLAARRARSELFRRADDMRRAIVETLP